MKGKPNILLIVMDAVRYDHLSCYGYKRKTTPNIDHIAKNGIIFDNVFSTSCWTPPSLASLFTGLYPSSHGVLGDNIKDLIYGKGKFPENLHLSKKKKTMAEILSESGYKNLGLVYGAHVSITKGFARGFHEFIEYSKKSSRNKLEAIRRGLELILFGQDDRASYINRKVKSWLNKNYSKKNPFFLFVMYSNCHSPFNPPRAFGRFNSFIKSRNPRGNIIEEKYKYMAGKLELTEVNLGSIESLYDTEISYLDFKIGEILKYLKKIGAYDDTFIIIMSDHGENLGEHKMLEHQFCLYDSVLHIPLIMRYPKLTKRKKRISSLISILDIFPTIFNILDIPVDYNRIQGKSLSSFKNKQYHRHIFAEYGRPQSVLEIFKRATPNFDYSRFTRSIKCVRTEKFKFILNSDGKEELYDLGKDQHENKNLIKKQSKIAKNLKGILIRWTKSMKKPRFEWEEEERIKELVKRINV